ncbi:MAG: hypothetical protein U1F87_02955 [Kiritimatiellia bacterium]
MRRTGPIDRLRHLLAGFCALAAGLNAAAEGPVAQPYLDLATGDIAPALDAGRRGLAACTLGFVVANPADPRTPSWGRAGPADGRTFSNEVRRLREAIPRLAVSFGGADHPDLAGADQTPGELADAYAGVCAAYAVDAVDFDVEGLALLDRAATGRRAAAWKIWRHAAPCRRPPSPSPSCPPDSRPDALKLLAAHRDAGAPPDRLNLMVMNYGPANLPEPGVPLADYALRALTNTVAQLRQNGLGDLVAGPAGVSRLGLTPMIGRNAVPGEVFQLDDARRLRAWAVETGSACSPTGPSTATAPAPPTPPASTSAPASNKPPCSSSPSSAHPDAHAALPPLSGSRKPSFRASHPPNN